MFMKGVQYVVLLKVLLSIARHPLALPIFVPPSRQAQSVRAISEHDYVSVSIMKPEVREDIRKPARTDISSELSS